MSSKKTNIDARSSSGQVRIQHQVTDCPMLPPAEQLEQFERVHPGGVAWLLKQTEQEAETRRKNMLRNNTFLFLNILIGQIFGFLIGLCCLFLAVYLAIHGDEVAAAIIGGATAVGLTSAFLYYQKHKNNK